MKTRHRWVRASFPACLLALAAAPAMAEPPTLSFPLDCTLNETCFIQNYVDVDPSAGVKDYRCNEASYDGHKGTDFRVLSVMAAKAGVDVLAAAAGQVKAWRDGVEDRLIGKGVSAPKGMACGNGVVIDHGQGWQTQYCHLRRGSVSVRKGHQVEAGERIGLVGYSGRAQFAHLHLSVRRDTNVIDPFTGEGVDGACGKSTESGLWRAGLAEALAYARGQLIEAGFADRPVKARDLEEGRAAGWPASRSGKALVFYARFINLEKGDRLRLVLEGPSAGLAQNTTEPLNRHKAQFIALIGRKRTGNRWPGGRYSARVQLLRAGAVFLERTLALDLP
ncbi:MAG: M23 family metallopeptidase [Hyphomicrobiales bacterium]|nr:M23 family metallopeptidase [Hyphomicrobiales bacterium]